MDSAQELRIASALYAGVADNDLWHQALRQTAQALDTERCVVLARHTPTEQILVVDNAGLDACILEEYEGYYHTLDTLLEAARDVPTGALRRDRQIMDEDAIRRSPFYNEFLFRHDIGSIMFSQTLRERETDWLIAFHRSRDIPHFDPHHERVLGRLAPHLQNALSLRLRLQGLEHRSRLGMAALNSFATPLLLVSGGARLLLANTAGESWFSSQAGFLARSERWRHALATATGRLGPALAEGLSLPDGTHVVVLPAPSAFQPQERGPSRLALVMVHTPQQATAPASGMLKSLFGLSSAEYRLLELLMVGMTLSQAAQHLGVSVETARTQSKAVLQKTGCRRQTDLMRLMSALQRPMTQG